MNDDRLVNLLREAASASPLPDFPPPETITRIGLRRRARMALVVGGMIVVSSGVLFGAVLVAPHLDGTHASSGALARPHSSVTPSATPMGLPLGIPGITGIPGVTGEDPLLRMLDIKQPLIPGGEQVTASAAISATGRTLYLPTVTPEGTSAQPEIWYDPISNEASVRYGSSLVLTYGQWAKGRDPASEYVQEVHDWKAGTATTISGNPAWEIPANAQSPGHPSVNVVDVSIGSTEIRLYSTAPLDQLITIASTLAPV